MNRKSIVITLFTLTSPLFASEPGHASLGSSLPVWSVIPFIGILLSIAFLPLFKPRFWHRHFPKVSLFWAAILAIPLIAAFGAPAWTELKHVILIDFLPFIILLWALFTVSGGICLEGSLTGTPLLNTILLAAGTAIASWTGTTGASMLMIRPVLRANANRKSKAHLVIFFIFLVSNIGGVLTPLGDPPLFLGFLHHVPFFWTLGLFPEMAFVTGILLTIFFIWDTRLWRKEKMDIPADAEQPGPEPRAALRLSGSHNFILLAGVVAAVLVSGFWHLAQVNVAGVRIPLQNLIRDGLLLLIVLLSWMTTSRDIRTRNDFTWGPIREVAILFAGIFVTIIPAVAILKAGEQGALAGLIRAVRTPAHYFWASGLLSSFLDNAPTYLTFFNTAIGRFAPGLPEPLAVGRLISENAVYLKAISIGAVFMGANTYIGNAPNFMVRSIAEENGVRMPSFFGYMGYSLVVLIPVFILASWIFF
ncbi:MAG: sodium:proton antiporter [bacterium]|nr:sodium:proton antiporter [bacterium]